MSQPQVVDVHIHYTPKVLIQDKLDAMKSPADKQVRYFQGVPAYTFHAQIQDLNQHVEMMDYAGVDLAIISSGEGMGAELDKCRVINDDLRQAMGRHDGRIVGMAHTSPLAGEAGLSELKRATQELGLTGAVIPSTTDGKGLDDRQLWPFYKTVQDLGQFIFVHPALGCPVLGLEGFQAYDLYRTVGREFDLVSATLRLIFGGVLDEFPDLNIVMSHFGGGITSLVGRIRYYQDKEFWGLKDDPVHGRTSKEPFDAYLSRLYFDTGGHFGEMTAVKAALLNIPTANLLFGTDYPQEIRDKEAVRQFIKNIKELPLSEEEIADILGRNALRVGWLT